MVGGEKPEVPDWPYEFGARVWLPGRPDHPGIVTGYMVRPGSILVLVQWPDREDMHYPFAITDDPEPSWR